MAMNQSIQILVVDDNKVMRRIIRFHLSDLGYSNVIEAASGLEAVGMLNKNKVDLILSDWNMEPMDGLTFLTTIKKIDKFKQIPFIMVTAESTRSNVIAAAQAGVSNYIIKPFSAETLKTKIEKVFA